MTGSSLGPFTSPQLERSTASILLVPLGSTEQHGPHLPLDTDTRIATAWADGIAANVAGAVVAPALPYGSSGEHQSFAGTLSIGQEALETLLTELIRSAATHFDAIVLVCGHAGNAIPVTRTVARMEREGHRVLAVFAEWDEARVGLPIDAHAGRVETSLLLHIAPDTVDLDLADKGATTPIGELLDDLRAGGVAAVAPNGVLGDPAGAGPQEGRRLLADLVERSWPAVAALAHPKGDC